MSDAYLCDGKDHVLAEGDCSHIFAIVRVNRRGVVPAGTAERDLCAPCLKRFVDEQIKAKTFSVFEVSSLTAERAS